MDETDTICKQHSGLEAKINNLEDSVSALWKKWDKLQLTFLGIFVTLALNLITVIFILLEVHGPR